MKLRTRILIGYGYLVALLVLCAAGAGVAFHQLGTDIGRLLEENVASIHASVQMRDALERQDGAMLRRLLDDPGAAAEMEAAEAAFDSAFTAAADNVTSDEETRIFREIRTRYEDYRQVRARLPAAETGRLPDAYESEIRPRLLAVKRATHQLLETNREAMIETDRVARRAATRRSVILGLLVMVALLSLGIIGRSLSRNLLARLTELQETTAAIVGGETGLRAPSQAEDELGLIARQFNAILDRQQEVEASARGLSALQRQLLLGLLRERGKPAALLSPSGDVIATTLDAPETERVHEAADQLPKEAGEPGEEAPVVLEREGGAITYRRLTTRDGRPVGWLAAME
ncbi:MAG: HAMP domain-containing protein [Candidatus Eisenbacteria bacterium]|nr:HAMP domain-containing protein [Candidatus Latescibacterota bacterium]MBD3301148.1 HAMP domain-containing protein [Candidatus Eisenbacteria bacterium]